MILVVLTHSPRQPAPTYSTRRVQASTGWLDSTRPTSQGRDLVSGVFTPTRRPTRKSTLHPTGGAIESALSTQTYLHQTPCASRPRLNRCFSTQPRRGVNSLVEVLTPDPVGPIA
jgi:hypothetical protein